MHKYLKIFEPLQALFSGAQKKQRAEAENHEIHFECKKTLFCCQGGQTLVQVVQRGCGVLIKLRGIQNMTGNGLGQIVLLDLISSQEAELNDQQDSSALFCSQMQAYSTIL